MDRAIANRPLDNVCCVVPSNSWACVLRPMWSWMGNSPPLPFYMRLESWACQWWRASKPTCPNSGPRRKNVSVPSPPKLTFRLGADRVDLWDAEDFDPWENLRWETVRVLFYRQHKPDGKIIEAFWLSDSPIQEVSSRVLFHRAKSRWEIENQGFNDAKNRHDLEHICHHQTNSLLITWLLTSLALTIERLYRLRYLRRGTHPPRTAADFVHVLWLSLSRPAPADSS
jgi:hypothetical protein